MLNLLEGVVSSKKITQWQDQLATANWRDGTETAGKMSASVKTNLQLDHTDSLGHEIASSVGNALWQHPFFLSAALPAAITTPLISRYQIGDHFGVHVDNAIRFDPGTNRRLRTDLALTLFLSEPDSYDGGELVIEDRFGAQQVKLEAGNAVLYPASSLHRVEQVSRGERLCVILWVQSMVREDDARSILFDLDEAIRSLSVQMSSTDTEITSLTNTYHRLIRRWATP